MHTASTNTIKNIDSWNSKPLKQSKGKGILAKYEGNQLPELNNFQVEGPTSANPEIQNYTGLYGFTVRFRRLSESIKWSQESWDVSDKHNIYSIYTYIRCYIKSAKILKLY